MLVELVLHYTACDDGVHGSLILLVQRRHVCGMMRTLGRWRYLRAAQFSTRAIARKCIQR